MKKQYVRTGLTLITCIAAASLCLGCVEKDERHFQGVHSFIVTAIPAGGSYGDVDHPLSTAITFDGADAFKIKLAAYAVDINGNLVADYNDTVKISAEPGQLAKTVGDPESGGTAIDKNNELTFVNGMVGNWGLEADGKYHYIDGGADVALRYAFGPTRIWVEDTERKPVQYDQQGNMIPCLNNKITEDGRYCEPTLASGTSQLFTFQPQTIRMIQYNPEHPDGSSPLLKQYGQLKAQKGHDLVVTNVVSTGFYVTDLGDEEYNSIFIFTFSQPGRVEIGDRVCEISGGIAEFTGMTQLQFPSWGIQNKEQSTAEDIDPAPEDGDQGIGSCIDKITGETRPCTEEELEAMHAIIDCSDVYFDRELTPEEKKAFGRIDPPAPKAITSSDFFKISNTNAVESLESSVVTVQDIRLSTEFVDCDDNGNSKIESGSSEAECRNNCTGNVYCTELSSLTSYDQWRGWTIEGNGELSVASSSLISGFDITDEKTEIKNPTENMKQSWIGKGCELTPDGQSLSCDNCFEWMDPNSRRRTIRCAERRLHRLTGNLKQVLPGCSGSKSAEECYASHFKNNMIMKVIEPRFNTDLIFDESFNDKSLKAFQECRADTQPGGCMDACKISSVWCTCDDFAASRADDTSNRPKACANRLPEIQQDLAALKAMKSKK